MRQFLTGQAPGGATSGERPLRIMLRKLLSHSMMSTDDQRALENLPFTLRTLEANDYILREGSRAEACPILLSGFAFRQKHSAEGGRQIVALKTPGDPLDLQSLFLDRADHNLQALTAVQLASVPHRAWDRLIATRPGIARAVMIDTLVEASIGREWLLNIGRRNAKARVAHFLCELVYRLERVASRKIGALEVPLTQEQLADLMGLTPVHINRTLKALEADGGVARVARRLHIARLDRLADIANFSALYLHGLAA
ncbi:Crp/Fnr family transcriptional regulator [Sphingopyxis terrae]|uniref:Crp/Fnr family transcriptional regulator n=1 Tax=Sphingopyxis terrae TaxID=33052 RepID=UPI000A38F234|nr:Crp/Fnr family transcriptional regulator [Sphingopyxis terrae]PCF91341.1 Crp/Fnr family transcriptional regulator [Sphingopyxis terrae subsp. ummariensis]